MDWPRFIADEDLKIREAEWKLIGYQVDQGEEWLRIDILHSPTSFTWIAAYSRAKGGWLRLYAPTGDHEMA